jgi:anti-sigma B factor antagonist
MTMLTLRPSVRKRDGVAVIDLRGEIDAGAEAVLKDAYGEALATGADEILLNFADVKYINSTGVALLVGLLARARRDKRTLLACGLSDYYRELFTVTRLSDFVELYADETAVLQHIQQKARGEK